MHRVVRVLLSRLNGRQVADCVPYSRERLPFRNVPLEATAQFCNDQGANTTLRKAQMFEIVHLGKDVVPKFCQPTMKALIVVFVSSTKQFLDVLDHHIFRLPRLRIDSRALDEVVAGIIAGMVARLLLAEASTGRTGNEQVNIVRLKPKVGGDVFRRNNRKVSREGPEP
nr:hypothetical protein BV87_22630 [Sphingobium yanoikuyae]